MRRNRFQLRVLGAVASILVLFPGEGLPAQTQPPAPSRPGVVTPPAKPPAPTGVAAKAPTGVIRGRVIAVETSRPIRRAQIRLTAEAQTATSIRDARNVATDEQGRYEITDLPAGRYTISASKTGYVTRSYGQRPRSESAPQPIEVRDGQALDKMDIALPLGGVAVVTVVDPVGEPLAGVQVDLLRSRFVNGQRTLMPSGSTAETNDLGQTRVHGLMPGEYYVSARSGFAALSSERAAYVPTFYPGTLSTADAQRVEIQAAQELHLALPVLIARRARLTGIVRQNDGTPIQANSSIPALPGSRAGFNVSLRQDTLGGGFTSRGIQTKPDGTFELPDVLPGEYTIEARPNNPPPGPGGQTVSQNPEFARIRLTVAGEDIPNIIVTTQSGATLRGQVVFDTGAPPPNADTNILRVAAYTTTTTPAIGVGQTTMRDDWSFEVNGVMTTGLIRLATTTTGWWTKSVVIDGKDVTETPIDFEPGRVYDDIRVTLTQTRAEVNGAVVDALNRPTSDYVAILFPEEPDFWFPRNRNIVAGRPDQNGQFKIPSLPPGRFLIAAVASIDAGEEQDPDLLKRLAPRATRLILNEGETETVTLKLAEMR